MSDKYEDGIGKAGAVSNERCRGPVKICDAQSQTHEEMSDAARGCLVVRDGVTSNRLEQKPRGPGYFLVSEEFARVNCRLDDFTRRQRERSDEARRANDGLLERYPSASQRFLVQVAANGAVHILSEHVVAIDENHKVLLVGPVPVAGRFKHEEVRAARRVMLAIAKVDPRLRDFEVIALTTQASDKWRDQEVLARMAYGEPNRLTREGIAWLAEVTRGADIQVFRQLNDEQLQQSPGQKLLAKNAVGAQLKAVVSTKRTFSFWLWGRRT